MSKSAHVSLATAVYLVAASMIGTGVFTSLGFQLVGIQSGFVILLLWLTGGLLAFCGAVCYAELSAALPRSGGEYHLLSRGLHPLAGFLSGWISVTAGFAAPIALAAMAFGSYVSGVLPTLPALACSLTVVVLVTAVYLRSIRIGSRFLTIFALLKISLIIGFIIAAFVLGDRQPVSFAPQASALPQVFGGDFAVSLMYVMYAYAGWNAATYIVNEIHEPQRNVPRSLLIGTVLVTVLYTGLNAAFLWAAPIDALQGELEIGLIAGQAVFGEAGGRIMGLFIALGLVSAISALSWSGPRVAHMMGEDYPALRWFGKTNRHGVPANATIFQSAIVLTLLLTATFQQVLIYIEFVLTLSSFLTVLTMMILRVREPDLYRPYKAWGYPVTPLLFIGITGFIMVQVMRTKPMESLAGLATLVVGLGLYACCRGGTTPRV
ncbi:MAG: APA family basic amino acid/polyamine antiporter [Kiritimatiellia bacterium]|jgi:basic amino acid/polyamine antiporter, APA family